MKENPVAKAQRYLCEARVRVLTCDEDGGTLAAEVRGSGAIYTVSHDADGWRCDCKARGECCHIIALKFVTVFG